MADKILQGLGLGGLAEEVIAEVSLMLALVIDDVLEAAVIATVLLVVNPEGEEEDEGHNVEEGVLEALTRPSEGGEVCWEATEEN